MTGRTQLLTLQEYLEMNQVTEKHYELVAGKLIQMPPESPQNAEIAIKLLLIFARFVSPRLLRCKDTEIVEENMLTVLICDCGYRETVYRGNKPISSPLFPQLQLTANQIFS